MLEFKHLAGLIMFGEADQCPEEPTSELHWSGSTFYFSWTFYENMNLASIRRYHARKNGFQQPTKVGLNFRVRLYDAFKEFLMIGGLFEEAAGLWPDQPILQYGHDAVVAADRKGLLEILKAKFGKEVENGGSN